ncbi:nucleotidyltransferase family protein [Clostridium vincentii]|uniref:D-glycero-alpha-D-manno-heptose 1-phosphate guanylyltransferase n=1 Tax=Clostridium vincentii TaxID=52704 RepID=A0A2T0BG29_9CLOT|nr:nucleotidyltransferase family protein [Clostridium vincentii]PRR82845.1 D-glycero-alpha-D-manno-heptose 1-phosphate guanylyltransferase [Clostridium vincentii]
MNKNIEQLLIKKNCTIKAALEIINNGAKGIVLVIDEGNKLIGTITDGDIRRALLKGFKLEESLEEFIHYNPVVAYNNMSREEIKDIFIKKAVKQIPILNKDGKVEKILDINDLLLPEGKENFVIIMAGGLGTRLKELTEEVPKPMLKVGRDPILQHIINNYKQYGYNKILLSVNYKAEIIENYFQSGYAYGVKIDYVKETKRLGTGGGIKLASEYIDKPFFVINGDIFTNLNVDNMMDFHVNNKFDLTVGVRKHTFQIPYGVIDSEESIINGIEEKPTKEYLINGGIYCINPDIIDYIPEDEYYEITELINKCIKQGKKVGSYEIKEYWMDIGKIEDYHKVNEDIYDLLCLDKEGGNNDK